MKWLIILSLLFIVWMFIAVRYRKQIQGVIYVWKMFRKMQQAKQPAESQMKKPETLNEVSLVKCIKCGSWVPPANALGLRSKTFYCSANCMESAVKMN